MARPAETDAPPQKSGRSKSRAGPRSFFVLGGSALLLFLAGSSWLGLYPTVPRDLGGAPDLDQEAEHVVVPVGEDDQLDLWHLRGQGRGVVLVFHGYGRDHTRAWRYGAFLHRAGYEVVTIDFRSSRAAHRKPTTLGFYETEDAEAALDWILRQPTLRGQKIGVLGESLGGSVALCLAARHPEVNAVVTDCAFADGRRAIEDSCERWAHVPRWPFAWLARWSIEAASGHDPWALDAGAAARRLRNRPIFFIHSIDDDRFSPEQARQLWTLAGAKDPLWIIPGVGHNQGWLKRRAIYETRVRGFFDHALSGASAALPSGSLAS